MTHEIAFPFVRVFASQIGPKYIYRWKPGVAQGESESPFYHGMGKMVITEIGRCSIEGFQSRVFYVRSWIDPDGASFGNLRNLRVIAVSGFTRLISGHRYRRCKLVARESDDDGATWDQAMEELEARTPHAEAQR